MTTQPSQPDIPVEVHGYRTDPLRRGYQILWNYESTYWRALVGNDAWSLYEVLRSFCHKGNNTCTPSINLLLAILGIKDRTVLIGRPTPKIVKGKEYRYPGLIEQLQTYNLVVAEVKGEGSKMRYRFHVDLTPGLLTDDQLKQLPKLLQRKHAELLKRCEEEKRKLETKKRPPKLPKKQQKAEEGSVDGGIGNSNTPLGNSNTPSWKFQYKHYPYNNTHRTTEESPEKPPNKKESTTTVAPDKQNVVVALTQKGISQKVAERLSSRYSRKRILEKIDYLEFISETDPEQVKNPQGWLRRAIEENYAAPDGYQSRPEREALATAQKQRQEEQQRLLEERRQQQAAERQQKELDLARAREKARRRYNTGQSEDDLWASILSQIKAPLSDDTNFRLFLADSMLVSLQDRQAVVWVKDDFAGRQVETRYGLAIVRLLAKHLDLYFSEINLELVSPSSLGSQ